MHSSARLGPHGRLSGTGISRPHRDLLVVGQTSLRHCPLAPTGSPRILFLCRARASCGPELLHYGK